MYAQRAIANKRSTNYDLASPRLGREAYMVGIELTNQADDSTLLTSLKDFSGKPKLCGHCFVVRRLIWLLCKQRVHRRRTSW